MALDLSNIVIEHSPGDTLYSHFNGMVFRFKVSEVILKFERYSITLSYLPCGHDEPLDESCVFIDAESAFDAAEREL